MSPEPSTPLPVPDAWEAFRTTLVDKTLHAYYVLAWFGLPLFIWRTTVSGWRAGSVFTVILVLAGMAFYRFFGHVGTNIKAFVLVGFFFGLAVPGLLHLGLLSNGLLLVASGCMAASLVLSQRTSILLSIASFLLLTGAGVAYVSGYWTLSTDANAFATSPAAWTTAICVNFLSALILVNSAATFRRSLQDLLIEVQRQRDIIEHQANHDRLTGLPTLSLATDRLEMAINAARRSGNKVAVLFLDLDGFKAANDTFGHDAGDEVLRTVATRIRANVRATDTACRIGGDEFLVILTGIPDHAIAAETARKLIEAIDQPITSGGASIAVGCSVGIAVFPDHADDQRRLRQMADLAMYAVKRSGKNNFAFTSGELAAPAAAAD